MEMLHEAIEDDNVAVVEFILKKKQIDPNQKNSKGLTAIELAIAKENSLIIQLFQKYKYTFDGIATG